MRVHIYIFTCFQQITNCVSLHCTNIASGSVIKTKGQMQLTPNYLCVVTFIER